MKERIVLSVELVSDNGGEIRCAMRVPYDCKAVIFGPWLDMAIDELRAECRRMLKEKEVGLQNGD